jgi:hypothetical protein
MATRPATTPGILFMSADHTHPAEEHEIDRRAPLFFVSYAHAAQVRSPSRVKDRDKRFAKFFEDLSENVAELVSLPAGVEPGYMDRSINSGSRWTHELLEAIGTCQVFVALLSARYFKSKWCGQEWYAFSQRNDAELAQGRSSHHTGMLPVIWAAPLPLKRPSIVSEVQRFAPEMPDSDNFTLYTKEGIFGLLKTDVTVYDSVVWKLAQQISEFCYNHWIEPHVLAEQELRDAFTEGQLGIKP